MQVINNDHVICFDVDDTLIMWNCVPFDEDSGAVQIFDVDQKFSAWVIPHQEHIDLLKRYKAKGKVVIVWSQSGFEWVECVVKALKLEEYVDFCMTKPEKYIDDLNANEWMEHHYIGPKPPRDNLT